MILRQAYLQTLFAQAGRQIAATPEGPERDRVEQELKAELEETTQQLNQGEPKND
jgi:hypothetical protein